MGTADRTSTSGFETSDASITSSTSSEPGPPVCGNVQQEIGEECDDGIDGDNDNGCTDICTVPACGDGYIQASLKEMCDEGENNNDNATCKSDCTDNACGDGSQGPGEECDDGNISDADFCTTGCKEASCGDGHKQPGEECDNGAQNRDTGTCTLKCELSECGDGIKQATEECDDGNHDNTDQCAACKKAKCSDGFLKVGFEECDDGNLMNDDSCVFGCKKAKCGDAFTQKNVEQCEDHNLIPNDGCSVTCKIEILAIAEALALSKPIPDDAYNGNQGSMACVDLVIQEQAVVKTAQVIVGLDHTSIGDLTFKLFNPGNVKTLTLMSRPGLAETLDDGQGSSPESSDLAEASPIKFRDGGAKDAESMGNGLDPSGVVCLGDMSCEYFASPGKGPGISFADFAGKASQGTWKFCAGDSGVGNVGTLDMVKLTLVLM